METRCYPLVIVKLKIGEVGNLQELLHLTSRYFLVDISLDKVRIIIVDFTAQVCGYY